jgi:hypothetical protein
MNDYTEILGIALLAGVLGALIDIRRHLRKVVDLLEKRRGE